ncbi:unnamed protein product [Bursaphelenchus okinawaensis]|uniref:Uncharacterized protein n=1 Tax=Bursaphelenchus okinawaensis TaxID=465554 RepID=A0A811L1R6_9BILA|nr:unnamed protein product [Bursaphelenchus okinawaensis]CAG9114633.1 unnamed protein product [Bursaphelenchus okinawaensis]
MSLQSLLCLLSLLPSVLSRAQLGKREADPMLRFSESMRLNFAHAREFSASFASNREPSVVAEQSNVNYVNPNQNGFVNWQQTLGQLMPNMLKFNANYNNNFGPENGNSFGFGPIGLPMKVTTLAGSTGLNGAAGTSGLNSNSGQISSAGLTSGAISNPRQPFGQSGSSSQNSGLNSLSGAPGTPSNPGYQPRGGITGIGGGPTGTNGATTRSPTIGRPNGQFGGRTMKPQVEDKPLTMSEKMNPKYLTTPSPSSASAERSTPSASWEQSAERPLSASTINPKMAQYWLY